MQMPEDSLEDALWLSQISSETSTLLQGLEAQAAAAQLLVVQAYCLVDERESDRAGGDGGH